MINSGCTSGGILEMLVALGQIRQEDGRYINRKLDKSNYSLLYLSYPQHRPGEEK